MKKLLFILTVLLCTVSCSKEETVQPKQFNWNEQLELCKTYKIYDNTYEFYSNYILKVKNGKDIWNGKYNIISINEIFITYTGFQNKITNLSYKDCYKSNDSIYSKMQIPNLFIMKELK